MNKSTSMLISSLKFFLFWYWMSLIGFFVRCAAHSTSTVCRRGSLSAYLAYAMNNSGREPMEKSLFSFSDVFGAMFPRDMEDLMGPGGKSKPRTWNMRCTRPHRRLSRLCDYMPAFRVHISVLSLKYGINSPIPYECQTRPAWDGDDSPESRYGVYRSLYGISWAFHLNRTS